MNLPGLTPWVSYGYPRAQAYACDNAENLSLYYLHPRCVEFCCGARRDEETVAMGYGSEE